MKTLAKRLRKEKRKVRELEKQLEIRNRQFAALERIINSKSRTVCELKARVDVSENWINALAGMIGDNFVLEAEKIADPPRYVYRYEGTSQNIEFKRVRDGD